MPSQIVFVREWSAVYTENKATGHYTAEKLFLSTEALKPGTF